MYKRQALYDLAYDPGERNNLAGREEYGEVLREMRRRLEQYQVQTEDPLLLGPIAVKPEWKVNRKECDKASSKNPDDYISEGIKRG